MTGARVLLVTNRLIRLAGLVNYTQMEQGSYLPGTKWSKAEEDFRKYFITIEGQVGHD
jgi:hypothetical protein